MCVYIWFISCHVSFYILFLVKPNSNPKSKSQIQIPNTRPKYTSQIQSPEERDWDWG